MDKSIYFKTAVAPLAESAAGGLTTGSAVSASGGLGSQLIKGPIKRLGLFFRVISMPYWVYILQNEINGKLYKGQTSDLQKRIERHNTGESASMR